MAAPPSNSDPTASAPGATCECQSWGQAGGKFLASHHRNCRHYDLEGDAHKVITDLLRGIEASGQDADGIHPDLWEAYKRGKASVWEFDWKEEETPAKKNRKSDKKDLRGITDGV